MRQATVTPWHGTPSSSKWAGWIAAVAFVGLATAAPASVFYKLNVVAESGTNGFTSLGTGPSVNTKGKVAFVGRYASGPSILLWSPTGGLSDIATNFLSPNRSFGDSVRINANDEVVTWNRLLPLGLYEVRVFRSATPNDTSIMVRGLTSSGPYDILYQNPAMNSTRVLEDRLTSLPGNKDGVCDAGEVCVSQIAFNGFRTTPARYLGTVVKNPTDAADPGVQHQYGLNTSVSWPMMADDGRIVVRGASPSDPILLFSYGLSSPTTIAGSSNGFTTLGAAPGITPDGKVIAFAGDRGHGNGIFLSIELWPGNRRLVRIVGENAAIQKAELGVDATNNKLYMQSIELDSRVGVIYTPDAGGVADRSVVVSFIGTPNGASTTNPGTGRPFLFSAQKGLWTMRIDLQARLFWNVCVVRAPGSGILPTPGGDDQLITPSGTPPPPPYIDAGANGICETNNTDANETLFSRAGPIPVVQIGDTIKSTATHTVSAISVNDPLAQATYDSGLVPRAARVGDHRVVFYAQVDGGATQMIVLGAHLDSDQDGLLDHWETEGIDLDGTGNIDLDLAAMGANPFHRDLFVQLDWTADRAPTDGGTHRPVAGMIRQLAQFYAAAPALPNGIDAGIQLHVDAGTGQDSAHQFFSRNMGIGPLRGGNTVTGGPVDILYFGLPGSVNLSGVRAVDFQSVKNALFWSHHRGAREFAFKHVVLADFHHASGASGLSNNVNPVTGAVSASAEFSLTDNGSATVSSASLKRRAILITSGTGAGQLRSVVGKVIDGRTGNTIIDVIGAWTTRPDSTSQFIILHTSSGEGEAGVRFDGAFSPGRNLAVTLGRASLGPDGETGSFAAQWRTFAHETGHLLSLMHGGIDHENYKPAYVSLMNYAYQFCPVGSVGHDENGSPLAGAAACPVDSYSLSDAVSNDYRNVDLRSSVNIVNLGHAFGPPPDLPATPFLPPEEDTLPDQLARFDPPDITAPATVVASPTGGDTITLGSTIPVAYGATDDVGVVSGEVIFDVNGDGAIDDATEIFVPTFTPPGSFSFTIPAVSGPAGSRTLTAIAYDAAHNPGIANLTVNVGSVAPVTVPSVVGQSQAAATSAITGAGLAAGVITHHTSDTVPAGSVISQSVAGGQTRPPGTAVDLVISLGTNGVLVPSVAGMSEAGASTTMAGAGLVVVSVSRIATSEPPGVTAQTPLAGEIVASGTRAYLLANAASAGLTVPNVVGMTQAVATDTISAAGMSLGTVTTQASNIVPAGSVISQTPAAGTDAALGDALDIVVSTGSGGGCTPGDVNGDGSVNVSDVFYLINYLFAGGPTPSGCANVNGDGTINVSDVFYLINYLFAGGPAPV